MMINIIRMVFFCFLMSILTAARVPIAMADSDTQLTDAHYHLRVEFFASYSGGMDIVPAEFIYVLEQKTISELTFVINGESRTCLLGGRYDLNLAIQNNLMISNTPSGSHSTGMFINVSETGTSSTIMNARPSASSDGFYEFQLAFFSQCNI